MEENKKFIEELKEQIKKIKVECIEKEDKLDELLIILNNETYIEDEFIEEEF